MPYWTLHSVDWLFGFPRPSRWAWVGVAEMVGGSATVGGAAFVSNGTGALCGSSVSAALSSPKQTVYFACGCNPVNVSSTTSPGNPAATLPGNGSGRNLSKPHTPASETPN